MPLPIEIDPQGTDSRTGALPSLLIADPSATAAADLEPSSGRAVACFLSFNRNHKKARSIAAGVRVPTGVARCVPSCVCA